MEDATSNSLRTGASVAVNSSNTRGPVVTRGDNVVSSNRISLTSVESINEIRQYSFPSDIPQHHMIITAKKATRNPSLGGMMSTNMNFGTRGMIRLPIPESLRDVSEVKYTQEGIVSLSSVAGAISGNTVSGGVSRLPFVGNFASSVINTVAGVADVAGRAGGVEELKARSGLAPNQMLTILLKGPEYKRHSFSWKMYPKNEKESKTIREIVNLFKACSRPGLGGSRAFFTFPDIFELRFTNPGFLFSFKPAVLETISVNYTPSGQPSFYRKTGAPDGIEMTLNFIELEYWLSEEDDKNISFAESSARLGGAALSAKDDILNTLRDLNPGRTEEEIQNLATSLGAPPVNFSVAGK